MIKRMEVKEKKRKLLPDESLAVLYIVTPRLASIVDKEAEKRSKTGRKVSSSEVVRTLIESLTP